MRLIRVRESMRRSDRTVVINWRNGVRAEVCHVYAGDRNTDRWAFVINDVAQDLGQGEYVGTLEACVIRWREFTRLRRAAVARVA